MEGTRIFVSHEAALFCGSSGLADLADSRVDDGVEKLIVIGFGLRLDVIADLLACGGTYAALHRIQFRGGEPAVERASGGAD